MLDIKAAIQTISAEEAGVGSVILVARGNYAATINGVGNPAFGVNVPLQASLPATLQALVDAVIADALSRGFAIESDNVLLPDVRRG